MMWKFVVTLGAFPLLTVLVACGGEDVAYPDPVEPKTATAPAPGGGAFVRPEPQVTLPFGVPTRTPTPPPVAAGEVDRPPGEGGQGVLVTKAEFGDVWPFTVDSGTADCFHRDRTPIFRIGENTYPLTGRRMFALADPNEIWRDDPNNPGQNMSFEPIAQVALAQCDINKLEAPAGEG